MGVTQFGKNDYNSYGSAGTAVSGTTVYRGEWTNINGIGAPSYQVNSIGTMTGTWKIQVCNRRDPPTSSSDVNAVDLTLATSISQPAGADKYEFIGLDGLEAVWVRPVYTNASGSGTIHAFPAGKE